jgi:hypothetical protein
MSWLERLFYMSHRFVNSTGREAHLDSEKRIKLVFYTAECGRISDCVTPRAGVNSTPLPNE